MYTHSIEDEMEFLVTLSKSSESLNVGERVNVTKCPNCDNGTVITHYKDDSPKPKFHHYCDTCGEIFDVSKLKAELFFNTQCWTLKELSTPFGDIFVTVNDSRIYFRYFVSIHNDTTHNRPFLVNKIQIDVSKLQINDIIRCPFPKENFNQNTFHDILACWYQDDNHLLAVCALTPSNLHNHCFTTDTEDKHSLRFTITKNPSVNDTILLAVVCLDKTLHKDVSISIISSIRDIW